MELKKKNNWIVAITSLWVLGVILGMMFLYPSIGDNLPPTVDFIFDTIVWWWLLLIPTVFFMRRDKERPRDIGFTKEKLLWHWRWVWF